MEDDPSMAVHPRDISPTPSILRLEDLHPAIRDACASRFASQHYSDGVQRAAIALRDLVRERGGSELRALDGDELMGRAFNSKDPAIVMADIGTQTGQSIQRGTMLLAQGAIAALRNPVAQERLDLNLPEAMEMVGILSLLARRVQQAKRPPFEATVEFMDLLTTELNLRKKRAPTGWTYSTTLGSHVVGVNARGVEFNLSPLRQAGTAQAADEIVEQIGDFTGRPAARSWPTIGCKEFMAGAQRARETVIEPYVRALRTLEMREKTRQTTHRWNETDFLTALSDVKPPAGVALRRIYKSAKNHPPAGTRAQQLEGGHFYWGTGKYPSVGAWYLVQGRAVAVWSIYTDPGRALFVINFEWMARNEISEARLANLVTAMRSIPGIAPYYADLEAKAWRKRLSIPTSALFAAPGADEVIIQALDRLVTGS